MTINQPSAMKEGAITFWATGEPIVSTARGPGSGRTAPGRSSAACDRDMRSGAGRGSSHSVECSTDHLWVSPKWQTVLIAKLKRWNFRIWSTSSYTRHSNNQYHCCRQMPLNLRLKCYPRSSFKITAAWSSSSCNLQRRVWRQRNLSCSVSWRIVLHMSSKSY